jgi:hypothetical protein
MLACSFDSSNYIFRVVVISNIRRRYLLGPSAFWCTPKKNKKEMDERWIEHRTFRMQLKTELAMK